MGKKQIVVPKSLSAQEALDMGTASPEDLIEATLTADEFRMLWDSGVFGAINEAAKSLIDDYEDERITNPAALLAAMNTVRELQSGADNRLTNILGMLLSLFEEAAQRKTEVHFFF